MKIRIFFLYNYAQILIYYLIKSKSQKSKTRKVVLKIRSTPFSLFYLKTLYNQNHINCFTNVRRHIFLMSKNCLISNSSACFRNRALKNTQQSLTHMYPLQIGRAYLIWEKKLIFLKNA